MTINRYNRPKANFTVLPNERWGATGLSPAAEHALFYLLTKPNQWIVRGIELASRFRVSEATARRWIDEMVERGYARRVPIRGSGKFKQWDVEVHELPVFASPAAQKTTGGDLSALGKTEGYQERLTVTSVKKVMGKGEETELAEYTQSVAKAFNVKESE
jgi:transposase